MSKGSGVTAWIHGLGALSAAAFALQAACSPFLAATQPDPWPQRVRFFGALADRLPFLPEPLLQALRGEGWFATHAAFLLLYHAPILAASVSALSLLALLTLRRDRLDERHANLARRWAYAFGGIAFTTIAVLHQDLWASVVWGQMIREGVNPYVVPFPADPGVPFDELPHVTNYGPLWAAVFGLAAFIAGGSALTTYFILKLVLAASWCGCLWIVSRLLRDRGAFHRAVAIVVVGWLPIGVHSVVAEGHNDGAMILLALLWVYGSARPTAWAPVMLAGSVLVKYVTAPLFLVDFLAQWRGARMPLLAYARRVWPAVALLVAGALFIGTFSAGARTTAEYFYWQFLTPEELLRLAGRLTGNVGLEYGSFVWIKVVYASFVVFEGVRVLRNPSADGIARLRLAIMVAIIFIGYLWPWYFVWCVPFAVLAPSYWLSWFIIGASVVGPFVTAHWWRFRLEDEHLYSREIPALVMYSAATLALVIRALLRARAGQRERIGG